MNRRSNKILKDLILGIHVNVTDLKEKYNVQERAIRTDIKEINEDLEKNHLAAISSDTEGNLWMKETEKADIRVYEEFIGKYDFYTYYLSKNERSTILAMILLNASGYVTVEQLKEKIGVSRNTLLRDLQELKIWFKENEMTLVSQVRRGYIVEAPEREIRKGILKLLEVNGDDIFYKNGYNLNVFWNLLLKEADKLGIYEKMKNYIVEEEEHQQVFLADYSFFEAVTELTIILNRIMRKQLLPRYYTNEWNYLKEGSKYIFSDELFEKISQEFHLNVREVEVLFYTECLNGKSYLKDNGHKTNALELRVIIAETIFRISRCFGIDFYLDFTMYDLLVAHMRSAVHRLKHGEILVNPLKNTLKRDYPEIFNSVKQYLGSLEEYVGRKFSEDEMSFMVLYFASVLEKEKVESEKNNRVSVALVCATGRGTVQFMLAKLKSLEDMIDIVSVTSFHNMKEMENNDVQMIISTIPLDETDLPYVEVRSPLLEKEDLLDIQRKVLEIREGTVERGKELEIINPMDVSIQGAFYDLLIKDRIQIDYPAKNWEEAVRRSGELLYETGAVEEIYIEEMILNIKRNGPYIVVCPGTALPHADTEKGVIKEAASIVRLKQPIDFHSGVNDPIRYVIGMSIQSAESINRAIYDLMMIFGNETIKKKLDQVSDAETMLIAIKQLENNYHKENKNENNN